MDDGYVLRALGLKMEWTWTPLIGTSRSGKRLFSCSSCGRVSATPDKSCSGAKSVAWVPPHRRNQWGGVLPCGAAAEQDPGEETARPHWTAGFAAACAEAAQRKKGRCARCGGWRQHHGGLGGCCDEFKEGSE